MKLSIVTINRNNAEGLRYTMNSVQNQTFDDFEYVVVDGASSDGSVEIISGFVDIFCHPLNWISEPDAGIFNAMNKGVKMCRGEYILFLNSGDALSCPNVLTEVFTKCEYDSDIIIGKVNLTRESKIFAHDVGLHPGEEITLLGLYLFGVPHQGSFIRNKLLLAYPYDETLKINSDWKFFFETIIMHEVSYCIIPETISNYDTSGISSQNRKLLWSERDQNLKEFIPPRILMDYYRIIPHFNDYKRVEWLLKHKFFYFGYCAWTSLGRKLTRIICPRATSN